jgi:hypothetical protein
MTQLTREIPTSLTIGADLAVGRLGYGAMQLTGPKVWGPYPDHDRAVALLRSVVDAGVTFIDTADPTARTPTKSSFAKPCTPTMTTSSSPPRGDSCGVAPSTPTWARSATGTISAKRRT